MKVSYEMFKEVALIYVAENLSGTELNSLLALINKLADIGIKQVIVDLSKAQPDSQAGQLIMAAKTKLRNAKSPQGLFIGKKDDGVCDFSSVTEAIERFPTAEGIKIKELSALQAELETLQVNLKAVAGVLEMSGTIEQKQKAVRQKNNYLKRIIESIDLEMAWLSVEVKAAQVAAKDHQPKEPGQLSSAEAELKSYFNLILNPPAQGGV